MNVNLQAFGALPIFNRFVDKQLPRKLRSCSNVGCKRTTHGKHCKPCDLDRRASNRNPNYQRFWYTKKKYGIDELDFETLWIAFRGRCGICGIELKLPEKRRGQSLDVVAIDHSHISGNVRGLLCNGCNKGIGLLKEDVNILTNAINYLEMFNEKNGFNS